MDSGRQMVCKAQKEHLRAITSFTKHKTWCGGNRFCLYFVLKLDPWLILSYQTHGFSRKSKLRNQKKRKQHQFTICLKWNWTDGKPVYSQNQAVWRYKLTVRLIYKVLQTESKFLLLLLTETLITGFTPICSKILSAEDNWKWKPKLNL